MIVRRTRTYGTGRSVAGIERGGTTRFAEGVTDFLQVLDAERSQLEAQDLLAQARTCAVTDNVALYKALGGA